MNAGGDDFGSISRTSSATRRSDAGTSTPAVAITRIGFPSMIDSPSSTAYFTSTGPFGARLIVIADLSSIGIRPARTSASQACHSGLSVRSLDRADAQPQLLAAVERIVARLAEEAR